MSETQGVLLRETQGDLQGDFKALSDIAQGDQGDLTHQLSYRENQVEENLESLIQSPLKKEREIIQFPFEVEVSLVSLSYIKQ